LRGGERGHEQESDGELEEAAHFSRSISLRDDNKKQTTASTRTKTNTEILASPE
jgi:hypothetical protein